MLPLRRRELLLPALLVALFFLGLGSVSLLEPDEGRYTVIPQAMVATGDWVTPRLDGVLYFEKPPLCYWINAASMRLFGFGEFQARLGSALFGLLGAFLAWLLGRSGGGARTGVCAAAILATSPLYCVLAHLNTLDMALAGCVGLALASFWMARGSAAGRPATLWWLGAAASVALAALAKGLIGLVLPGGAVFLFLLVSGEWGLLKRVPWILGTALFLSVALPWHLLAAARNPGWAHFYIVREHFLRYTTTVHERTAPWWFFAPVLLAGFLPWTGLLPAAFASLALPLRRLREERSLDLFLISWALFPVLFFSASQSKLIPYVLPSFLPLAVLGARVFVREAEGKGAGLLRAGMLGGALALVLAFLPFLLASLGFVERFSEHGVFHPLLFGLAAAGFLSSAASAALSVRRELGRGFGALVMASALGCACIWAAAPRAALDRSFKNMALVLQAKAHPGDAVFSLGFFPQTLAAYLNRPVGVVDYLGELEFGASQLDPAERVRRFPSIMEFKPTWESGSTVYLVTTRVAAEHLQERGLKPGYELFRQNRFVLLVNRPPGPP